VIRTGHKSVADARRELVRNGYTIVHTAPGTALRWARPSEFKRRNRRDLAVAIEKRARSTAFTIVDYPEGFAPVKTPVLTPEESDQGELAL
jgi:hypothetical protein